MRIVLVAGLVLFFICPALSPAQDVIVKKTRGEDSHHHSQSFACDESCGFSVRSHDENEAVGMVRMHAESGCACCQDMSEEAIAKLFKEGEMSGAEAETSGMKVMIKRKDGMTIEKEVIIRKMSEEEESDESEDDD